VWGVYNQRENTVLIEILYGEFSLKKLKLEMLKDVNFVDIQFNDKEYKIEGIKCEVVFPEEIDMKAGDSLKLTL
jgi:hypothetical protein